MTRYFRRWAQNVNARLLTLIAVLLAASTDLAAMRGEPLSLDDVVGDLRQVRAIYLGKYHTIPRHHLLEEELVQKLARGGVRLVLAMEQFEFFNQGPRKFPGPQSGRLVLDPVSVLCKRTT